MIYDHDLTEWYPGYVKPVYVGYYQRRRNNVIIYSRWDGVVWRLGGSTMREAKDLETWVASFQNCDWRGVKF